MADTLRICLAQLNLVVGDVAGNTARIAATIRQAREEHAADLVVFQELALCGYPPEDLLFHSGLQQRVADALEALKAETQGIAALVGYPEYVDGCIYNSAAWIQAGEIRGNYRKSCLPNYGVFDEQRYFTPGKAPLVLELKGVQTGVTICEDIWDSAEVAQATVAAGAEVIFSINGSPFEFNKQNIREELLAKRAREAGVPIVYQNLVGGQDELVFDGGSCVVSAAGTLCQRAPAFVEGLYLSEFKIDVEHAIALGAGAVQAVMMPYLYTSDISIEDAEKQARELGVAYSTLPIAPMVDATIGTLADMFAGLPRDATEENIQARCRGILLMAISNKTRRIVLTTGNKSEMAVGYATLYGDMAGGFAPIKDCAKTLVYRLARYRNTLSPAIPERVIERPPSAELRPDQKDSDSLPPYDVLDPILDALMIEDLSVEEIVALGYEKDTVGQILDMVRRNEYKRRQSPPGVRISGRAFGRDWRYPMTSGYGRSHSE
jgi:NAD+ synthase (glutamine-hydrolysing)